MLYTSHKNSININSSIKVESKWHDMLCLPASEEVAIPVAASDYNNTTIRIKLYDTDMS